LCKTAKTEVLNLTGPVFVKWIETTLFQNDISKETFYAESGISTANMAQWRSGDYNPSKRSVQKAELFFEKYAKNEKPATVAGDELSENKKFIIEMLPKLSDSQAKMFRAVIEQVLAEDLK
jgi:oligoribonuclease (3'-5' exoribonuclease)